MRYHHQVGAVRERKKIGKGKIAFVALFLLPVAGYVGFLSILPNLGGWPVRNVDEVANTVKTTKPGSEGDHLFIPGINVAVDLTSRTVKTEGDFGVGKSGSISADTFAFGVTPDHILNASPFYRLNKLQEGNEFYIDRGDTRYAYRVSSSVSEESRLVLKSTDGKVTINAEPVGVVAWNNGEPRIEVPADSPMAPKDDDSQVQ